jgi:hypothetical protein
MAESRQARWPIAWALAWGFLWVSAAITVSRADEPPAEKPRLADYFGFLPLEIYKLDQRIGHLLLRDLDGDQVADIVVSNNARSRIDLLLTSRPAAAEAPDRPFRTGVNEVEYDRRMRLATIPVNKEVVSLDAGDLTGDGLVDLVYYGTPAEVQVLPNEGGGRFGTPRRVNVGEAIETPGALAVGDLDRDGRIDLVLLAENDLVFVYQTSPGVFREPERIAHTATTPRYLKLVDLDGDGSLDVVILDGGTDHPFHVRFGMPDGTLGPEQRFAAEPPRAWTFGQIDGQGGAEILILEGQSGRCKVLTLDDAEADDANRWGQLTFFGLPHGQERGRALATGDLDGDGSRDVVVTDPANAQVWVYRRGQHGLGAGQSFPGLLGGRAVRLGDLDQDGIDEVYVLSEQERQIGRSQFVNGRLGFPVPLPLRGEPLAFDLADLDGDGKRELIYAVRRRGAGPETYALAGLRRDASGEFVDFLWGAEEPAPLPPLSSAPTTLKSADLNADGRPDFVVFTGYGPPTVLLSRPDQPPAPLTGNLGPMAGATPAGFGVVDLGGPAVVVAQTTFARRILLDPKGQWEVQDQYNAGRGSAQVQGVSALDLDRDGTKEIILFDRARKALEILAIRDGAYRPVGTIPIGSIAFEGLDVADFDGDGREDLLIAGTDRFGILQTGRTGQRLKAIASYESRREKARFSDLSAGDVNHDGIPDVVFVDIAEQSLEIATFAGEPELLPALSFRIYERKLFRGVGDLIEPRDLAIGDVDGDGRNDLVLVIHDRVLVLRQDPGSSPSTP